MKKLILLFLIFPLTVFSQPRNRIEYNLNAGPRNTGISADVNIAGKFEFGAGVTINRYNSIGLFTGLNYFPFLNTIKSERVLSKNIFASVGYKFIPSATYNHDHGADNINNYLIPATDYIVTQIGYRYNIHYKNEDGHLRDYGYFFHMDVSGSITYDHKLSGGAAVLRRGDIVFDRSAKISAFYNGGLGFQITFHIYKQKG